MSLSLKVEAKINQKGENQVGDIRSSAKRRQKKTHPNSLLASESREDTAFREQMLLAKNKNKTKGKTKIQRLPKNKK